MKIVTAPSVDFGYFEADPRTVSEVGLEHVNCSKPSVMKNYLKRS
jgi:hypothetical protein